MLATGWTAEGFCYRPGPGWAEEATGTLQAVWPHAPRNKVTAGTRPTMAASMLCRQNHGVAVWAARKPAGLRLRNDIVKGAPKPGQGTYTLSGRGDFWSSRNLDGERRARATQPGRWPPGATERHPSLSPWNILGHLHILPPIVRRQRLLISARHFSMSFRSRTRVMLGRQ